MTQLELDVDVLENHHYVVYGCAVVTAIVPTLEEAHDKFENHWGLWVDSKTGKDVSMFIPF